MSECLMDKVCPVVLQEGGSSILVFRHPQAGIQLVKGTVEPGEDPASAALRELREESGIVSAHAAPLGAALIGTPALIWHFFRCDAGALPDRWDHPVADGGGHIFSFFWHPLEQSPGADWYPDFQIARQHIIRWLGR
jgi:8-oxo-dGTP pyrophosphatase MutT (NUDIX family)